MASTRLTAAAWSPRRGDTFATKREAYYVSKNWGEAKFNEQPESDAVMDDIEAMFAIQGVSREQLRFYPEERLPVRTRLLVEEMFG